MRRRQRIFRAGAVFKTKQDQVADILREGIIAGVYKRGEKLKQAEIALKLGVSITPVREALHTLEAEGYIAGVSHKGLVVPFLDAAVATEVYELRVPLERDLTQRALAKLTPAGLKELRALHKEAATARGENARYAMRTANYRLHFKLYETADRPQTLQFVRILWAKYPFGFEHLTRGRSGRMIHEHEAFLAKAQEGDIDGAVQAMVDHIHSGWNELTRSGVLAQLTGDSNPD
jgi:DNA-binding GntR family transcriptional regulator